EILQAGEPALAGMAAPAGLGELHLVADEDQVPGRETDGDGVRQRDLARFVDEDVVEAALQLLPAKCPRGAADQYGPVAKDARRCRRGDSPDWAPLWQRLLVSAEHLI